VVNSAAGDDVFGGSVDDVVGGVGGVKDVLCIVGASPENSLTACGSTSADQIPGFAAILGDIDPRQVIAEQDATRVFIAWFQGKGPYRAIFSCVFVFIPGSGAMPGRLVDLPCSIITASGAIRPAASNDGILVYYHKVVDAWSWRTGEGQLVPTAAGICCPPEFMTPIRQIYTISSVEIRRHTHPSENLRRRCIRFD